MAVADDRDQVLALDRRHGPFDRPLQQRAVAGEGAILFGPVFAQPALGQGIQPAPFAARQDDAPARIRFEAGVELAPSPLR